MNISKPLNQTAEVLYELLTNTFITRKDIFNETGILNVTARITNLRSKGLTVPCKLIKVKNKHGREVSYGQWELGGEEKKALQIYKQINTTEVQKRLVNKLAKSIIPSGAKTGNEKIEL